MGWARVHYTYDTAASYGIDRLHRGSEADGVDGTVWSYTARGLPHTLAQTVGGRTATFTYGSYDPQDRLLSARYPDCETVTTRYDATGQPAGAVDESHRRATIGVSKPGQTHLDLAYGPNGTLEVERGNQRYGTKRTIG